MTENEEAQKQLITRSSSKRMGLTGSSTSTERQDMDQVTNRMQCMMFSHGNASYRALDYYFWYSMAAAGITHLTGGRMSCYH